MVYSLLLLPGAPRRRGERGRKGDGHGDVLVQEDPPPTQLISLDARGSSVQST